jgi:invasion protein IalB
MASPLMRLGVAGLTGLFLLAAATQASAQAQQPQQPQGPVKLDLIGTQAKWTKVCGHDQAANRDVCYTTRDFSAQANQPPVIAVAVYDIRGDDTRIVRLLMPVGLMLRPGFRFWIDKGETLDGSFEICFPNGCFAEAKIKGPTLNDMKGGTTLSIAVRNQANNEVTFAVPLAGFGDAFSGPAVDPKVLQAEQEKFQDELKKRAEEEKKRLQASKGAAGASGGATGGASLGK